MNLPWLDSLEASWRNSVAQERAPHAVLLLGARGRIMIPPPDAQFGVISDIDDTVLRSNSLNYLKLARNVFLKNARTRLPFEGVAAFYEALQQGTEDSCNPIFYLSKSPWNLYDLLIDFFAIRGIPLGPLFLTDLGISPQKLFMPHTHKYKLGNIQLLLDTYDHLPFILIGDSGEKDADIYDYVAERYPGRILAIYIRNVTGPWREAALEALKARAEQAGVEMILAKDTGVAAAHALAQGFIRPDAYPQVMEARAEDHKAELTLGKLLDPGAEASEEGER
jgi:phosphatidate phosphatase APP1